MKFGSSAPVEADLCGFEFTNTAQDEMFACARSHDGHTLFLCFGCGCIVQGGLSCEFECCGLEVCCLEVCLEWCDRIDLSGVVLAEHDLNLLAILSGC